MENTKENKYTVIKNEDLLESLTETERSIFNLLLNKAISGKPHRKYYVVNKDEPYSHKILEVILDGEESKGASYQERILDLLVGAISLPYNDKLSLDSVEKIDFNFTSYPLLGILENEIQPAIGHVLQGLQNLNARSWRLGKLERFRDNYSFQDVYIGEVIIESSEVEL